MTAVYIVAGVVLLFFIFYRLDVRKAREDGANEARVSDLEGQAEKNEKINEMESEIEKEFEDKTPKGGGTALRDFFKRGG